MEWSHCDIFLETDFQLMSPYENVTYITSSNVYFFLHLFVTDGLHSAISYRFNEEKVNVMSAFIINCKTIRKRVFYVRILELQI